LKWVCFFILLASILADVVSTILANFSASNLWVINLYILIDSLLVFYFYYWKFRYHKNVIITNGVLVMILLGSWVFHNLIAGQFHSIDSWTNGIETLSIIFFSILFFYGQLLRPQSFFVYSTALFWIVAGILLYKAGTFFLILYFDTLEQSEKANFGNLYIINSAFLFIRNIFFTIAFLISKPAINKKSHSKNVFQRP